MQRFRLGMTTAPILWIANPIDIPILSKPNFVRFTGFPRMLPPT